MNTNLEIFYRQFSRRDAQNPYIATPAEQAYWELLALNSARTAKDSTKIL